MTKSKRLIFFGNERLATGVTTTNPTLAGLIEVGYDIAAVVANYTESRSRSQRKLEIEDMAKVHNIPLLLPDNLGGTKAHLTDFGAEAGVLVAYGDIVPLDVIELFPKGIINIHPSLLPKYRGSTPIETAILEGAPETGVSLMQLVAEMDAGPVFVQEKVDLSGHETKQELADRLLKTGADLLIKNLPTILDDSLAPTPQDETQATITERITKDESLIDWNKSPDEIEKEVRAYAGWPKSRGDLFGNSVILTKVRVATAENDGELVIKSGSEWLEILELIAPSGRTMSGADFLRGYRKKPI